MTTVATYFRPRREICSDFNLSIKATSPLWPVNSVPKVGNADKNKRYKWKWEKMGLAGDGPPGIL